MGRKISNSVVKYCKENNIDTRKLTGTLKGGNVGVKDLQTYLNSQIKKDEVIEAEVIELPEFDYNSIIGKDGDKLAKETEIRMYQLNSKTGDETWNMIHNVKTIGIIDGKKTARMIAKKLHEFTSILIASGVKSSFSLNKPLWFEVRNGMQRIDFNSALSTQWKIYIKGKRGKNINTQAELIANIETLFRMNDVVKDFGAFQTALPKAKKTVRLNAKTA